MFDVSERSASFFEDDFSDNNPRGKPLRQFTFQQQPVGDEELSYFGVKNATDVGELIAKEDSVESVAKLRVMHCTSLVSLAGVNKLQSTLVHLNASSNNIQSMKPVQTLANLEHLDLSCNQLTKIEGLASLVHLKVLRLGHNRLTSLQPF